VSAVDVVPVPEPAVRVAGLTRHFGSVHAVSDVSFTVQPGELFGLVGPDGAGKTTTLRMLAGVLPPTSGEAHVLGTSVTQDPEGVKQRIAYMSQRFGLYTDLTVRENIDFYADLYLVPRAQRSRRLERLYRFSNLEPFGDRLAGQLSGGMKQKLGLSCALIHQPEVLLLDEPTFGVDPVSRRDLWLIVHEMVESGVTVIVSTAYMDEAERFDRLAFLHKGVLLATATPDELKRRMRGALYAVRTGRLRQAGRHLTPLPGVLASVIFGDRLHVTVDPSVLDAAGLERALSAAGFEDRRVEALAATLEDVFIASVREAEAA
jgi:ABC-2 type transport system ATP-binding protein